jgi:hypothetical protein
MEEQNEMLEFVKALSHADRLRVVGVLARKAASAKDIAETLGMPLRDVVQHLEALSHGGVVIDQGGVWSIDTQQVEDLSRRQFEGQRETYTPAPDLRDRSRKVLAAFLNTDGTLKQIPSQPAKLQVILDYVVQSFTPSVIYTEKEVNMIIRRFPPATASLRREMIDRGMMERKSDGSQYWRPV